MAAIIMSCSGAASRKAHKDNRGSGGDAHQGRQARLFFDACHNIRNKIIVWQFLAGAGEQCGQLPVAFIYHDISSGDCR